MESKEALTPYPLRHIPFWHIPIPSRRRRLGTHLSSLLGVGSDISEVRALEPGEDRTFYSPHHSAEFHEPWGVFFKREEWLSVTIFLDYTPGMRFSSRGKLTKFDCAVKIISSLVHGVVRPPNEGSVSIVSVGEKTRRFEPVSAPANVRSVMRKLLVCEPQSQRGQYLSLALKDFALKEKEGLILLVSDFLWPADSIEWENIREACRVAKDANHEVVFIRILDEMEQGRGTKFSSISLSSKTGQSVWTSLGIRSLVKSRQGEIRDRISEIVEKPKIRFFESLVQDPELGMSLKLFVKRRARLLRSFLMRYS